MKMVELAVTKSRNKMAGLPPPEEPPKQVPTFPLVDVPDASLDEEQIKEKRRQRLMKAGYDAREKARIEREEARAKQVGIMGVRACVRACVCACLYAYVRACVTHIRTH